MTMGAGRGINTGTGTWRAEVARAKTKRRKKKSRRKPPVILTIFLVAAGLYTAACGYLYIKQRDFLYIPPEGPQPTGEQTLEIQGSGVTLRGWVVNPGRDHAIIYFGGNAERIENNMADYGDLFTHHTIYFVNYRGYGGSTGSPTEEASTPMPSHLRPRHKAPREHHRNRRSWAAGLPHTSRQTARCGP